MEKSSIRFFPAEDWDNWSVLTNANDPDSLILLVHIEKDKILDADQIEIGEKKLLLQNMFNRTRIKAPASTKHPFIILIGCETVDLDNYGFDVSNQLLNEGAAVVISNFTKIRGRYAGPILIKLVEHLKQHTGEAITLGQLILKTKQYLLSKGIMVGLALVAQGDDDWQLKT